MKNLTAFFAAFFAGVLIVLATLFTVEACTKQEPPKPAPVVVPAPQPELGTPVVVQPATEPAKPAPAPVVKKPAKKAASDAAYWETAAANYAKAAAARAECLRGAVNQKIASDVHGGEITDWGNVRTDGPCFELQGGTEPLPSFTELTPHIKAAIAKVKADAAKAKKKGKK